MRKSKFIKLDILVELFRDFYVEVYLTDGPEIYLKFPSVEEYAAKYSAHFFPQTKPSKKAVESKNRIANLLSSSEFWRKTTVAHWVGGWALEQKEKVKTRKRRDEPFTIIFESHETAKEFYEDLEYLMNLIE